MTVLNTGTNIQGHIYRDKYTLGHTGRGIYANANTLHILSTKEWEPVAFVICMH